MVSLLIAYSRPLAASSATPGSLEDSSLISHSGELYSMLYHRLVAYCCIYLPATSKLPSVGPPNDRQPPALLLHPFLISSLLLLIPCVIVNHSSSLTIIISDPPTNPISSQSLKPIRGLAVSLGGSCQEHPSWTSTIVSSSLDQDRLPFFLPSCWSQSWAG